MGRHTCEVGVRAGIMNPYPHLQQYVVSRTMPSSPEGAVRIVSDDPSSFVRSLKQDRGLGINVCGGADLAGALYGEIDELILKVNPVVLAAGKPLFAACSVRYGSSSSTTGRSPAVWPYAAIACCTRAHPAAAAEHTLARLPSIRQPRACGPRSVRLTCRIAPR